jgi:hypothetical protein
MNVSDDDVDRFWKLSIPQICSNMVKSILGITDDVTKGKRQSLYDLFSRDDRLTYIGILFITIGVVLSTRRGKTT